jgi:hypothetical protein
MAQAFALTIQSADFYAISFMYFWFIVVFITMKNKVFSFKLNVALEKICNCRSSKRQKN